MSEQKHFNQGIVYGRVLEVKEEKTKGAEPKPYLSFKVSVTGPRCGQVTAFCRMYGDRIKDFLADWKKAPRACFRLQGQFSQYRKNDTNEFLSNYTLHQWDVKDGTPRAIFILRGEVKVASATTDHGQRMILLVKPMQGSPEEYELWVPGEAMLEEVSEGDFIEAKGLLRQAELDEFYEDGEGPVRAYVEKLRVLA